MVFMGNINDFVLTLVALSLPSIAATIDCNGKPFHCMNSTHFMICVDFGSGVSSTMDDFVIPCPPTTVCQATNRFECDFPTVPTTTVTPMVTNSPLAAAANNDVVIDTVSDVTTIPFEEYLNTISTTTLSGVNLITRVAVTTKQPVNNLSESFHVPSTDSNTNVIALNVGVSPNYFTTLATLDMVTEETTVTERNMAENVNFIFEPNSNKSAGFPNATEVVQSDIDPIKLSENNTVDVTENYESNSTSLETIIGATNFRKFNTSLHNTSSYDVTEPILSEVTENIVRIPNDDKQVYLTTLEASPDVILYSKTIENVTESIPTVTTKYRGQFQSNLTLNETMSTGVIAQNDSTTLNTSLDSNAFALNVNNPDLSFKEITTKYEEEISTAESVLFEVKENTMNIPLNTPLYNTSTYDFTEPILSEVTESIISLPNDGKQVYVPTLDALPNVFLDDQTIDNATESIPAETTDYKSLIKSQSNRSTNKPLDNSTSYDITEPILSDVTESIITIPVDDKQTYLSTLDASLDEALGDQTIDNVTDTVLAVKTYYKNLSESQNNSTLNKTMSGGNIVQNDTTKLNTVLTTNESALNVNNSDKYVDEVTTKYEEQISTAELIFNEAKESGDFGQSYTTTVDTVLNTANTNESTDVHSSNITLNEDTQTFYKEQISIARNNYELTGNTATEITQPEGTEMANITKPKLSVSMIATTSTNTTVKLNEIESRNKTSIFNDFQTTELSYKDPNHYLTSTEDYVTALVSEYSSDNTSVKPENNTIGTQSENLTNVNYVENVTKTETETEEIHLVLPKPPRSSKTTTIINGKHTSADNTSTTYTIPNIDTIIAQNKTTLNDIPGRTDEVQRVTSDVNLSDKTADATENNHLLQPLTEPTSTTLLNTAHNVLGSDLTNKNSQEMTSFIKRIEHTARSNVTNKTLTHNDIGSDMNISTGITESNHIELNNRVSVATADDQINTVEISESTPNYILETATQEVDSLTYSNVYYQTDIEEIGYDPRKADTIESTSSILVLTTEIPKELHFDAALKDTTSFNGVSDKMYVPENDTYFTSTTYSPLLESTPSSAFDIINSAVDTSKPVTREHNVEEISTRTSKLGITSAINENLYNAKQNITTTDDTNSPQQTAITSSTALVNTNSAVKQVTRQVLDERISTEPSTLIISFTINETAYVATEQNIPSAEVTPEAAALIPDQFKYTTTTETANDSVHQIISLSAQNNRGKETLRANTTSNTATDLSAIPNLKVSYLSGAGVTNIGEEMNGSTVADSLTTETTVDAISKTSTDNEKQDINPANIRNSTKTNTTTKDITVTDGIKYTEPLRSYSIQRENKTKLEILSVVTDKNKLASFTADVNYTENINKLADTQDRVLSNAQAEPKLPEILFERFGANVYDPNFPVNKETFKDGFTSIDTAVAAGNDNNKLTRDEINQQSPNSIVTRKISTTETLLNDTLKEKDVLPVMPELKTNSESIVKTSKSIGDINANPVIRTKTSSFESLIDRKLSLITSIQESKYKSNLPSSTESWRATVVTEPVVHLTRPHIDTLITSSKPYTELNENMSQDVTSVTPKLNLAHLSEEQYINTPQNIESVSKNVPTSLEPSVFFPQVTEPSVVANQDGQSSSVRKSTTQKSYGIDTQKLVQNHGVSAYTEQIKVPTTEKLNVNVIPIISPSDRNYKTLVDVKVVPILKSSNNISKENAMSNTTSHLITAVYNSTRTVESVPPKIELNIVDLNITSKKEKTMTKKSDLDIIMVDVVNTDLPNLGEIATGSNNTHSGISAAQKSSFQQIEKHKGSKSVTKDEHETEMEAKPEVAQTNPSNDKIGPIKKQDNVQPNPALNTKQKPVQNVTTKNVPTSLEHLVIFPQVTEPSGVANQDGQSSSVRKSTTQKSYGIDTQKLVQNQGVSAYTEQIKVPTTEKLKVNVIPIISQSVRNYKTLVDVKVVPILKSSNNISTENAMSNATTHLITAVYNSNRTVESVPPKIELNKVDLIITSTNEKTMTKKSNLDIVMVDVVNTDSPNLGEIATGSNNTHSGISAAQKSSFQQIEKHKGSKSVTKDEHETKMEEKPEVAQTNPSNDKIGPIKKQDNVQANPALNTKQKPVQNVTTRTRPVDFHIENTTARYNTKTKSSVANTHNSTLPTSETSKQNFVCKSNNRGRFSDNRDCRKFYICIGKHEPIKGICPNNTVFSELRKQCTKNLSHCVRNNQFQCVSEGRFSDYFDDNIYYICVNNKDNRFIRFKLQCQSGYHLNKTSVRCVMNTGSIISTSQQSQQSASELSTSNQNISAKSEKIKEEPKTNKNFECKRSGKFPEPNDCRKYYVCRKLGKSEFLQKNKKCDSDEVYNRDKKKCVDADSYECS